MNQNKNILNDWYDTIKDLPHLTYQEAKSLYVLYLEEVDLEKKKILKAELIEGLLYLVYDYLNNTKFDALKSISYDMSDIIDTSVEFLIRSIDNGVLLKYSCLGFIFNDYTYYMFLTNTLIEQKSELLLSTILCKNGLSFAKLLLEVKKFIDEYGAISYEEFVKLIEENKDSNFYFRIDKHNLSEFNYRNTYKLLLGILKLYKDKLDGISLTRLESIRYLLIDSYLEEDSRIDEKDSISSTDDVIDKVFYEEFRKFVYSLDFKDLELLKMRYGFDDYGKPYTLEEVGKCIGITPEAVRKKENGMLRVLRNSYKSKRFLGNKQDIL